MSLARPMKRAPAPATQTATRRPTPGEVAAIVADLKRADAPRDRPALVAALRRETGCSRATAYRAVSDALAAGTIKSGA